MYILGKIPQGPPSTSEMWSVEVHQDSDIGSATSSWTLHSILPEAHPGSHHTVDSTKPLLLFCSPTERVPETRHILISLRSRPTTRRRLSWFLSSTILLSSHSHSLFRLISPDHESLAAWWCLISEGLNKLVEYTAESPMCGPKAPILQHTNMHIKFNYRETDASNRIGVPSETVLRKSKRRCSRGVRGGRR